MTLPPDRVWRVFPWDPRAEAGAPYSATYVPPVQGQGRFDLPATPAGVLYLAETPDHAVAETIQHYRGHELEDADLIVRGHRLALVGFTLQDRVRSAVADLCDSAVLVRLGIRPDDLASRERRKTQAMAATLRAEGHAGLRWWSAFFGDWHTVVLFRERLRDPLEAVNPEPLEVGHPALREAARALGLRLARR